jgi:hypothetical protein
MELHGGVTEIHREMREVFLGESRCISFSFIVALRGA